MIEERKEDLELEGAESSPVSDEPKKVSNADMLAAIKTKQGRRIGRDGVWLSEQKHAVTIANPESDYIGGRYQTREFTEAESREYSDRYKKGLTLYFSAVDPLFQVAGFKNQMYILDLNRVDAHPVYKKMAIAEFERLGYRERTEVDMEIINARLDAKKKHDEELEKIDEEAKRLDKLQRVKKK